MNVFITGATGNVGSAVVRQLLRNAEIRFWILLRASSEIELAGRLHKLFVLWGLSDEEVRDAAQRIHPLQGDMGLPRFGMNQKDWEIVQDNCGYLIHAAGVVRMNLPIEDARKYAVGSARNVIELADGIASSGRVVNVAFVSTVGVAGKQDEVLVDDWVTSDRAFHNTYEQSKAEAESLLRGWNRSPFIRLTVHRPSMVVGASDGEVLRHQIFFYICEFLSGRHTKGLQPAFIDGCLDTVPVDYVADAVCWAVQNPVSDGRIFNLCSGSGREIRLATVQDWTRQTLSDCGQALPRLRSFSPKVFLMIVRALTSIAPEETRKRLGTLPILIDYLNSPQVFEGKASRDYLEEMAGLRLLSPEQYLPSIIRSFYRST